MLSNVTPIGYVRHSHNKGIVAIQCMEILKQPVVLRLKKVEI